MSGEEVEVQNAESPPERIPAFYMIGDGINWNSERVPIQLMVELPFWLLMPTGTIDLTIDGCTLRTTVVNEGVEFQWGHQFTKTHQSTAYLGSIPGADRATVPLRSVAGSGVFRFTRTLVSFDSSAHADAIVALTSPKPRCNEASLYFTSFALGHLAFLNHLINTYRRVAVDPYVTEVSEWDVPVWFVSIADAIRPIYVFPYSTEDSFPTITNGPNDSHHRPYFCASLKALEATASNACIPGEVELLDGWSLYYRGRYGDSIRSFVTAVEVLLEAKLRTQLELRYHDPRLVEEELGASRNNFWDRMDHYCELIGVRIPGPKLHFSPYLNGLRLRDEMERTRSLRHEIVHHGHRLDHTLLKPMRRAAETTSWFFDWLSGNGDFEQRRCRYSTYFEARRGSSRFPFEIRPDGVTVLPLHPPNIDGENLEGLESITIESTDLADISEKTLVGALGDQSGIGRDIEFFTLMVMAMLKVEGGLDSPPPPRGRDGQFDRYRIVSGTDTKLIFVLDTHAQINTENIDHIWETVDSRTRDGLRVSSVLAVVNEQNGVQWDLRRPLPLIDGVDELAKSRRIALVRTEDLARLMIGLRRYGWSHQMAYQSLLMSGWNPCSPPGAVYVGVVRHFYAQPSVASIDLVGEEINSGNTLVYRLRDGFHEEVIRSMQQNNVSVESARSGRVGVVVSLGRSELPIDSAVCVMPSGDSRMGD